MDAKLFKKDKEMRKEFNLEKPIKGFIKKHVLTTHEYNAISTLIYYPEPIEQLSQAISAESENAVFGPSSILESEDAIKLLIKKKIMMVSNKKNLEKLQFALPKNEHIESIVFPDVGDIEFSKKGGNLVLDLFKVYKWDDNIEWGNDVDISPTHIRLFDNTLKALEDSIEFFLSQHKKIVTSISPPKSIGAWWSRCWLRFPKGVTVDIKLSESRWEEE